MATLRSTSVSLQLYRVSQDRVLHCSASTLTQIQPERQGKNSNPNPDFWPRDKQRAFIEEIGLRMGISLTNLEKWYKVSKKKFVDHGGAALMNYRKLAVPDLLIDLFPEHRWDASLFPRRPQFWKNLQNHRSVLLEIGRKLGIAEGDYESWYNISTEDIIVNRGEVLLKKYNSSVSSMICKVFSEHQWDLSKFAIKPHNYWKSLDNQRDLIRKIESKLGIKEGEYEKWYKVRLRDMTGQGARPVLVYYDMSLVKLLIAVFPEHKWDPSKFVRKADKSLELIENSRKLVLDLGAKLGISERNLDAWYNVPREVFLDNGFSKLLTNKKFSIYGVLSTVYPEHKWDKRKLNIKRERNYWKEYRHQRSFMEELAQSLGFPSTSFDSWYRLSVDDITANGGAALLKLYGNSLLRLLSGVFPEHTWDPKRFSRKNQTYWHSIERQRDFMLNLGREIGFKEGDYDAWYRITNTTIIKNGGTSVLSLHGNSVLTLLSAIFPEHSWDPSKFVRKPRGYWTSEENRRAFLEAIGRKIGIREGDMDAWYKVSNSVIHKHGGTRLLHYFNDSPAALIQSTFRDHDWNPDLFCQRTPPTR